MDFFGKKVNKTELLEKIGDMSQLGGISSFEYNDGVSKGIRAFNIKCISGIDVTILEDRGMDISHMFYKSIPINWNSISRETSPFYYNDKGFEWLRSFYGGLLTTCGLLNIGDPCIDDDEDLGLHGRISNMPFEKTGIEEKWTDEDFIISIRGKARDAVFKGNKLELSRKITACMFNPKIIIEDSIINLGYKISPLMILYHINIGYPLLDSTSNLLFKKLKTIPLDENSAKEAAGCHEFDDPVIDFNDEVFFHDLFADKDGNANIAIVNQAFNNNEGLGLSIKFNKDNLPYLTQWKHLEKGEYVCGIEPCNSYVRGRATERKEKNLQFIGPGEQKNFRLEFNILKSNNDINMFKNTYLV
ncbi:MAG: aldose 1-epimerase family protein [Actinobacteria bacterium]|nr:aldose 1-epimerase family protein [Actinomycetota bacterium]